MTRRGGVNGDQDEAWNSLPGGERRRALVGMTKDREEYGNGGMGMNEGTRARRGGRPMTHKDSGGEDRNVQCIKASKDNHRYRQEEYYHVGD